MPKSVNHVFEKLIEDSNLTQAVETPTKKKIRGKARNTAKDVIEHFEEEKANLKDIIEIKNSLQRNTKQP